jgi:hypothetical protein
VGVTHLEEQERSNNLSSPSSILFAMNTNMQDQDSLTITKAWCLDQEDGDNFWEKSIEKEMKNV